jgi:hypothetical protein
MANAAQGVLSQMWVKTGSGQQFYDSSAEAYEFVSEDLSATRQVLDTGGIRGTRSYPNERVRLGIKPVGGTVVLHPSPADLDKWLPRILGAAEDADSFALGDTFDAFAICVDRVTETFEYTDCKVSRADFRSQPNGFLEMTLTIVGTEEYTNVATPTSAPTCSIASNAQPYVFHDTCGNIQLPSGTARQAFDISISIDNMMDARFTNCSTASSIMPTDRLVTVSVTTPFDASNSSLHTQSDAMAAAFVRFTNGNMSLRFDFPSLRGPDQSPTVNGRGEIVLRNDYVARSSGASAELTVTSDSSA